MAIDAIVRVSLETSVRGNRAVNKALVGHAQNATGPGPFTRGGTHAFSCMAGDDSEVMTAIKEAARVLDAYATEVDYVSITLVRHRQP